MTTDTFNSTAIQIQQQGFVLFRKLFIKNLVLGVNLNTIRNIQLLCSNRFQGSFRLSLLRLPDTLFSVIRQKRGDFDPYFAA